MYGTPIYIDLDVTACVCVLWARLIRIFLYMQCAVQHYNMREHNAHTYIHVRMRIYKQSNEYKYAL